MAKKTNFENEKKQVKEDLLNKCDDAGCGKKDMIFRLKDGYKSIFIPATSTIQVSGCAVNLCYSKRINSPFADENEGIEKMKFRSITLSDGALVVHSDNRILQMYLFLSPFRGMLYDLVDEDKEKRSIITLAELKADAFEKVRTANIAALRAVWYVIFKGDPGKRGTQDLTADLYGRVETAPKIVLEAFSDESAKNKYLLFTAIRSGILMTDENLIVLSWKGGVKILTISIGQDLYTEFAKFVQTDSGNEVRVQIEQALEKL